MNTFLKKAFGWLGGVSEEASGESPTSDRQEMYRECVIRPTPMREGSQWRLAGVISKEVDGETRERSFIRADLFTSSEEAESFAIRKGQQIIDQNGETLFAGEKTGTA